VLVEVAQCGWVEVGGAKVPLVVVKVGNGRACVKWLPEGQEEVLLCKLKCWPRAVSGSLGTGLTCRTFDLTGRGSPLGTSRRLCLCNQAQSLRRESVIYFTR
jgi:hypothetical protein